MNEAEKIKKKLERYAVTPQAEPSAPRESEDSSEGFSGDIWSWKPEPNWKPPLRYVQPEPDYSKGFKVGDFWPESRWSDGHLERQALPHPRYSGKVGDTITREMETAYSQKWEIWHQALMSLERCIRLRRNILDFQDDSRTRPDKSELQQMFDAEWQWLKGLWNATPGMSEPTEAQINTWGDELIARYQAQKKSVAAQ